MQAFQNLFIMVMKNLNDDDFFGIEDEDLNTLNLADRINLHFKIGNLLGCFYNR